MKIQPQAQADSGAISALAKIRQGKKATKLVTWPGSDLPAALQVLTVTEVQECHAAAFERFKELGLVEGGSIPAPFYGLFEDEIATQVVFKAYRDAERPERTLATTAQDLRDNSTVEERSEAFDRYAAFEAEVNPAEHHLDDAQLREIEEAIKKKDATELRRFGSSVLATYLLTSDNQPSS